MAHDGDGTTVLVTRYGMGDGPEDLRLTLADNYFKLLAENEVLPETIAFYGEGVKLVVDGSPVLEQLGTLEAKGVRLVACTTCLNFYELMDRLAVGVAGGMTGIIEAQFGGRKVIAI
jgi:intracellular sulfur oxidation DsrE/DsrF family protein